MSHKNQDELFYIIDDMASAAMSLNQGAQGYEAFIKTRDSSLKRVREYLDRREKIDSVIEELHNLV